MNPIAQQMESARRHLEAARFLFESGRHTASVPVAYYAAFNALKALMLVLEDNPKGTERYRVRHLTSTISREHVQQGRLPKDTIRWFHAVQQDRFDANYRARVFSEGEARLNLRHARRIVRDAEEVLQ